MKNFRWLYSFLVALVSVVAISGCGGGGGDSNSNGVAGGTLTAPGLSISPASLAFVAKKSTVLPSPQVVTLSISAPDVAYIGADVSFAPSWLSVSILSATKTSGALSVSVNTTDLIPGVYTATFEVGIARTDQSIIATRVVTVSYTITNNLSATPGSFNLSHLVGAVATSASLSLSDTVGKSYGWTASVSYQGSGGWLTLSQSSGTSLPSMVTVSADPNLASGTYNATILIASNDDTVSIPVTYTVRLPSVTVNPSYVSFSAENRQTSLPPAAVVEVRSEGAAMSYTTDISYATGALGWLTVGGTSVAGQISIQPNNVQLAAGTYSATVRVIPSNGGQPISVGVVYTVNASSISVGSSQASFSATGGQVALPTPATIAVSTAAGSSVPYSSSITYGAGASGWLTAASGTASDTLTVSPNTTNLEGGTYTAVVKLTPDNGAASVNVNISYVVTSSVLTLSAGSSAFALDNASTNSAANLQRTVVTGTTGAALTWVASSSAAWLTTTASGSSGGNALLGLVLPEIEKLDPGNHSSTVTFTYTRPNGTTGTIALPVTLNLQIANTKFVAPYVAIANSPNSVIVRGQGFTGLTVSDVLFGTINASSINVVSDTEIRAILDPMTAASYPANFSVTVPNQLGLNRSRATLVLVQPQSYGAVSFVSSGQKTRVVFDDERRTVYVLNRGTVTLERYAYDAGTSTWTTAAVSLPQLQDVALSTDGTQVVAVSDAAVRLIDPSTLVQSQQIPFSTTSNVYLRQIAFANNGKAMLGTGYYGSGYTTIYQYDMVSKSVAPLPAPSYFAGTQYFTPLGGSADGSRIVMGDNGVSPDQPVRYYAAGANAVYSTGTRRNVRSVVLNRDATKAVLNGSEVFDGNLTLLGALPGTTGAAVLSPSGAIAFTYDGSSGKIRKFDLNGALVAGVYPEIGAGTTPVGAPISSTYPAMGISQDGNTLVIAGDQKVVIMPVP